MSKDEPKAKDVTMNAASLSQIISQAVSDGIEQGLSRVRAVAPEDLTPAERKVVEEVAGQELQRQLQEPRFLVTLHKSDRKDAVDPVPINVNGILRTVKRGEPAILARCMVEVLEHSVEERMSEERDEKGFASGKIEYLTCYPYTIHREIPKDEWDVPVIELAKRYVPGYEHRLSRQAA